VRVHVALSEEQILAEARPCRARLAVGTGLRSGHGNLDGGVVTPSRTPRSEPRFSSCYRRPCSSVVWACPHSRDHTPDTHPDASPPRAASPLVAAAKPQAAVPPASVRAASAAQEPLAASPPVLVAAVAQEP